VPESGERGAHERGVGQVFAGEVALDRGDGVRVAATVFSCLGVDPHGELTTDAGRPVQLFREGKVMRGVA